MVVLDITIFLFYVQETYSNLVESESFGPVLLLWTVADNVMKPSTKDLLICCVDFHSESYIGTSKKGNLAQKMGHRSGFSCLFSFCVQIWHLHMEIQN